MQVYELLIKLGRSNFAVHRATFEALSSNAEPSESLNEPLNI